MRYELGGKVALITGAARGLGLQLSEDLAREGTRLAGMDMRADLLDEGMQRLAKGHGTETLALHADVSDEEQVINAVAETFSRFGQIDILINNAGIRKVGPVHEVETAVWDEIHGINLRGQFLCTREALRQGMLQANTGKLVFISSGSGKRGEKGSSAYCASKFGVTGFAQSVARDLKDTLIAVTTVFPGMVWTPMAEESEVAHLDLEWLDARQVSRAIVDCLREDENTIIPELIIYHRAQI